MAFVDDNPAIRARRIVGVPVRGSLEDVGVMISRLRIEEVVLSSPQITANTETRVREICAAHGCAGAPSAHGYPVSGRRLRVGVDGRAFASPAGGVRRYVRELYTAIAQHDSDIEVVAIGAPPDAELPPALQRMDAIPFPTNLGWMLASMPLAARRAALDVYHAPAYTAPLWGVHPQVLTIHDVSYERRPEWNAYRNDPVRRLFYRTSARVADRIVTDSGFSRTEISLAYGIPEPRIDVVPLAAATTFTPGEFEAA